MATNAATAKSINGGRQPAADQPSTAAAAAPHLSTADTKLLTYVRTNAPFIVSALACAASRAGEAEDWAEMQTYVGIANEVATQTGVGQTGGTGGIVAAGAGTNRSMVARAGSSP
jgi:hypothetical protein